MYTAYPMPEHENIVFTLHLARPNPGAGSGKPPTLNGLPLDSLCAEERCLESDRFPPSEKAVPIPKLGVRFFELGIGTRSISRLAQPKPVVHFMPPGHRRVLRRNDPLVMRH